jgi:hypothetical protein
MEATRRSGHIPAVRTRELLRDKPRFLHGNGLLDLTRSYVMSDDNSIFEHKDIEPEIKKQQDYIQPWRDNPQNSGGGEQQGGQGGTDGKGNKGK